MAKKQSVRRINRADTTLRNLQAMKKVIAEIVRRLDTFEEMLKYHHLYRIE